MPASKEYGGLFRLPKAHLNISVQAKVFIRREREIKAKRSKGGECEALLLLRWGIWEGRMLRE